MLIDHRQREKHTEGLNPRHLQVTTLRNQPDIEKVSSSVESRWKIFLKKQAFHKMMQRNTIGRVRLSSGRLQLLRKPVFDRVATSAILAPLFYGSLKCLLVDLPLKMMIIARKKMLLCLNQLISRLTEIAQKMKALAFIIQMSYESIPVTVVERRAVHLPYPLLEAT